MALKDDDSQTPPAWRHREVLEALDRSWLVRNLVEARLGNSQTRLKKKTKDEE